MTEIPRELLEKHGFVEQPDGNWLRPAPSGGQTVFVVWANSACAGVMAAFRRREDAETFAARDPDFEVVECVVDESIDWTPG